jgi:glyoxylase-like metal-dependent hydrolase (beta-lactamase superfamily II)
VQDFAFKTDMAFDYGEASPMAPGIVRVVAPNPGPFTHKGTNTYLIGSTSLAVIDPGPDSDAHRAAILRAAAGRPITHILSTHAHRDHVDGVARLKDATGAAVCAYQRPPAGEWPALANSPSGRDFIAADYAPDLMLGGGDRIEGEDWALTAIFTPGHAPDHLSFALDGRDVVFTGDHIMAWNTTVIAPPEGRMSDYIRSLEILLDRDDHIFLPGHGGRMYDPQRTVKAYLLHRRWREQSILKAMSAGATTARQIVPHVYNDLSPALNIAALLSVLAHLELLIEKGQLIADGSLSPDCALAMV